MTYKERAEDLYAMLGQGQGLEAFEKHYHAEVVAVEADGSTREGKDKNREALKGWYASVKEHHGGGFHSITANEAEAVTMVESWADVSFHNGGRMKLEEVCVQRWKDGQIIHERYYYNIPAELRQ
ncbi:MAG: SnoaL-like domain-containing protein [Bacteroidota bacterium]